MINRLTHVSILVKDQEDALRFFTEKLGFKKGDDNPMEGGHRWLTIKCSEDDREIILQAPEWGLGPASADERRRMIGKQPGLCFHTSNAQKAYTRLKDNGVDVLGEPQQMPWGHQLLFKDLYGNVHLMVQEA